MMLLIDARLNVVENKMLRVLKVVWLLCGICILIWGMQSSNETKLVAIYLIGLLTIPSGLVIFILGSLFSNLLRQSNTDLGIAFDFVIYSSAILMGYIQWFVILPKIIKRIKHEKSTKVWGLFLIALIGIAYGLFRFYVHIFPSAI